MRVLIADDHPLYRLAVRVKLEQALPDIQLTEAASLEEALSAGAKYGGRYDAVLIDLHMPGMKGAATIRRVIDAYPNTPVVLISGFAEPEDVRAAVAAGICGFLPKTMSPDVFAAALAVVTSGGTYVPINLVDLSHSGVADKRMEGLSARERKILGHLASGASNKEIGRHLDLAEVTIKVYVRLLLKKIGARNRSDAATIIRRMQE